MSIAIVPSIRETYQANGYTIFSEPVLDADLVRRAREGMDKVRAGEYDTGDAPEATSQWKPGDDPNKLCKIEQPQKGNAAIRELISSPEIGRLVAAVTGAEMVQVWWVQLLFKPPSDGKSATKVGWHQDWTYWQRTWEGEGLLTAWFALSDVREESGPMKFVIGSHKWEGIGGGNFSSQDIAKEDFTLPAGAEWNEVPAVMKPGGMSLHHRFTLHGSGENVSKEPRRSFAIHLRTEKSRAQNGERKSIARHMDMLDICPIIYGEKVAKAFE